MDLLKLILNEKSILKPIDSFQLAVAICNGMSALHNIGVIHLDLKPQNVLIKIKNDTMIPVITDFGISRIIDNTMIKGMKRSKAVGLTPRYSSPELFNMLKSMDTEQPANHGMKKMDIYSFAITIYEIIERRVSWEGMSFEDIQSQVIAGNRPGFSSSIIRSIDRYILMLVDVIIASWAPSPNKRPSFADIAAMFDAI